MGVVPVSNGNRVPSFRCHIHNEDIHPPSGCRTSYGCFQQKGPFKTWWDEINFCVIKQNPGVVVTQGTCWTTYYLILVWVCRKFELIDLLFQCFLNLEVFGLDAPHPPPKKNGPQKCRRSSGMNQTKHFPAISAWFLVGVCQNNPSTQTFPCDTNKRMQKDSCFVGAILLTFELLSSSILFKVFCQLNFSKSKFEIQT